MSIIPLYFSLSGRIRRRDWWVASILLTAVSEGIELVSYMLITGKPALSYLDNIAPGPEADAYTLFSWVLLAAFAWPSLCISVKRWHDRNRTGWAGAFVLAVTYAVFLSRDNLLILSWGGYMALAGVVVALNLWQLIECGIREGSKGPNRYGPSPKGIGIAAEVF